MPKNKDISMTREDHARMRKEAGYKFTVTIQKPYNHYKFLETLSKLQQRGEKNDESKKI